MCPTQARPFVYGHACVSSRDPPKALVLFPPSSNLKVWV